LKLGPLDGMENHGLDLIWSFNNNKS
jgi:hypothetical protein